MEKDLKTQNIPPLTALYVGTFLLLSFVHWSVEEVFAVSLQLGQQVLMVGAIATFGAALSHFLPNNVKHPLVYFRVRNALSGHRCTHICKRDPRLRSDDLERKWPALFSCDMNEREQNAYWYNEIYRPVRDSHEVMQAHRNFLLFRDGASGLFVLSLGLLLWKGAAARISLPSLSVWSLVILAGVILVLCQAAKQSGDRMVVNSVAVAIAGDHTDGEKQPKEG